MRKFTRNPARPTRTELLIVRGSLRTPGRRPVTFHSTHSAHEGLTRREFVRGCAWLALTLVMIATLYVAKWAVEPAPPMVHTLELREGAGR